MSKAIKGSINLNKIDKSLIFDGKKGQYLDIVLVPTPGGKYYNYMIVQDTAKDEDSIIIGNADRKRDETKVDALGEPENNKPF